MLPEDGSVQVVDSGPFTFQSQSGRASTYCVTKTYPSISDDDDEPMQSDRLTLYVVPNRDELMMGFGNFVSISGSLSVTGAESCICDGNDDQLLGYSFPTIENYIPAGTVANLSDIYNSASGGAFATPDISASSTRNILIYGDLIVDEDYVFGSGVGTPSSLTLGPNANIIVANNATFTLLNNQVYGCQSMWESIRVEAGGKLIVDNTSIQDSEYGVWVNDGGEVEVLNSTFKNNYRGIYVPSENASTPPTQQPMITVLGSEFTQSRVLKAPHFEETALAGAEINDVISGIFFGTAPNFFGNQRTEFSNMQNGLILNRTSATVTGSIFTKMLKSSGSGTGNGILIEGPRPFEFIPHYVNIGSSDPSMSVIFDILPTGVKINRAGQVRVYGSTFQEVDFGVIATSVDQLRLINNDFRSYVAAVDVYGRGRFGSHIVRNNRIDARQNDNDLAFGIRLNNVIRDGEGIPQPQLYSDNKITMNGAKYGVYGNNTYGFYLFRGNSIDWAGNMYNSDAIKLYNGGSTQISGTLIQGNSTNGFTETKGISMESMRAPNINCNAIDLVETGMYFFGNNTASVLKGNELYETAIGLQLGTGDLTTQPVTLIGQQGNNNEFFGNRWVGPFQSLGARHEGGINDYPLSLFLVNTAEGPEYLPTNNVSGDNWFLNLGSSTIPTYKCPTYLIPEVPQNIGYDTAVAVVINDSFIVSGEWAAETWMANEQVTELINDGLIDPADYPGHTTWKLNPLSIEVQNFASTADAVENIFVVDTLERNVFLALSKEARRLQDDYDELTRKQYIEGGGTVPFHNLRMSKLERVQAVVATSTATAANIVAEVQTNLTTASQAVGGMSNAMVYQQNTNTVHELYFIYLQHGIDSLMNYAEELKHIAAQCPYDGGSAVYAARSLFALTTDPIDYNDIELCRSLQARPIQNATVDPLIVYSGINVAPNPATDWVSISNVESGINTIKVYSNLGVLVQEIAGKGQNERISVAHLPQGVYLLQVLANDATTSTHRIILQR